MANLNEKIEAADKLRQSGEFDQAEAIYREVVAENPEKWQAWQGLGFIRLERGEFQQATEAFGKSRVIRADDVPSHYGYGLALQNLGDHAAAIRAFEEALYRDHNHPESRQAVAVSLLAQVDHMRSIGNLLAVEEYLEKAHKYDPANRDTTLQLMQYYETTGQAHKLQNLTVELQRHGIAVPDRSEYAAKSSATTEELPTTISGLRQMVENRPEEWRAWRALGYMLLESDEAKEAESAFRRATVIRPDDVESQRGLGLSFQAQGDHNHAIHAFEAGLSHSRTHIPTKKALNESLLVYVDHMEQIGNLLAVEQYLERAHKNDLSNEDITRRLLRYYNQTGQSGKKQTMIAELERHGIPIPEAGAEPERKLAGSEHANALEPEASLDSLTRADLEALVAQQGENWKAWRTLGFELIDDEDYEQAAAAFKRATVIRFDDADSQYGLGLAHQKQGDHAHAIHPFEEALRQNPRHDRAKSALKESLLAYADHMVEIRNLLAVEQFLEKAYQCDTTDRAVGERLFNYYRETGQSGKAAKLASELGMGEAATAESSSSTSNDILLEPEPVAAKSESNPATPASAMRPQYANLPPPAVAAAATSSAVAAVRPAMLPCPSCRQSMPGQSKICPHCRSMVDPVSGVVLSGRASQINATPEEIVYKIVSWFRIAVGAALVIVGLVSPPSIRIFIIGAGVAYIATGAALLFEIDWVQTVIYWLSLLGCLGALTQLIAAIVTRDAMTGVAAAINLTVNGLTAWAIYKLADV